MHESASLTGVHKAFRRAVDPERAKNLARFFKTGKGEYGEGDRFLGLTVPQVRAIAKAHSHLPLLDVRRLLTSPMHEERLCALLMLVQRFRRADSVQRARIVNLYLRNLRYVNNWDLVDLSAPRILGEHLKGKPAVLLKRLSRSPNVWERRVAVLATFAFIQENEFSESLRLAERLMGDPHDLIHKAVGWMLREIGKRSLSTEERFLRRHYKNMPRTMLRYAIERFPEVKRRVYLSGRI